MRKIAIILTFFLSFIITTLLLFPYKQFYGSIIQKATKKADIKVSYIIDKAFINNIKLKNIMLFMPSKTAKINYCDIRINPLGILLSSDIIKVKIYIENNQSSFSLKRSKDSYIIYGKFKTFMLANFLDEKTAIILKNMKGTDILKAKVKYKNDKIIIENLKISGDFNLFAKGYIKNGQLRLTGSITIGRIKENFSI